MVTGKASAAAVAGLASILAASAAAVLGRVAPV